MPPIRGLFSAVQAVFVEPTTLGAGTTHQLTIAMTRQFLGHRACHHIAQGRCQFTACVTDHAVCSTGEQGREHLAQTVFKHQVNLALQVGENALNHLLL